jgi:hypothetical protein
MISKNKICYFAGLFDGEGCVYIAKNNCGYSLAVAMGLKRGYDCVLTEIFNIFGGNLRNVPKPYDGGVTRWYIHGKNSYNFLKCMLPYSIIKKEQIMVAMEFYKKYGSISGRYKRNKLLPEERQEQESYYIKLKELKRKK